MVRVYRNLHAKAAADRWSIRQGSLVVAHCDRIELKSVAFIVNQGGRRKVLETGRKNVHAFIEGTLIRGVDCQVPREPLRYITFYNPRKYGAFVWRSPEGSPFPVYFSPHVRLTEDGVSFTS
jgi:hypothetical protein